MTVTYPVHSTAHECDCGRTTANMAKCEHCLANEDTEGLNHGRPGFRSTSLIRARSSRSPRYYGPRRLS